MSVYIKGMEMPKIGYEDIRVFADGSVTATDHRPPYYRFDYRAIPVPPHGRLIDADEACRRFPVDADPRNGYMLYKLNNELPTIIPVDPAEEGET